MKRRHGENANGDAAATHRGRYAIRAVLLTYVQNSSRIGVGGRQLVAERERDLFDTDV